ncbi:phage N-6-adenine-methyltransferase [Vibrio breoganii]|uniref:phage N-6-adenine-methyltransferase n=1 Tax=Vibrio breoganii TaxID=553239 RepID=UPI000C84FDC6|nr:phage N-6-adenine-methyltransferase [Vibrio breoganii]PMK30624.1 phage N-6-adenine-methyltransferase [Vibrio breoganii]
MSTEHKSNTEPSIRDLWRTPQWLYEYLDMFGHFDMDVAASEVSALHPCYLTPEQDALNEDTKWGERVFCNPPYSNIRPWIDQIINRQVYAHLLVPSDTSVGWWNHAYQHCAEVIFIVGRISFVNFETGAQINGNNKGSCVFVFDPTRQREEPKTYVWNRDEMRKSVSLK